MGRWDRVDVPHKGWVCVNSYDLCEDGAEEGYAACEMCGQERIRYVHVMRHEKFSEELKVGCVCAEKMSDDYIGPKNREKGLRNISSRRRNWITRKWRVSSKGNDFLNVGGHNIVVFSAKNKVGYWGFRIDSALSRENYEEKNQAKLAAFDLFQINLNAKK